MQVSSLVHIVLFNDVNTVNNQKTTNKKLQTCENTQCR